jgi:hypothetical protein
VSQENYHESGNNWRTADMGVVTQTQIGINNDNTPIYHQSNGKRPGSRLHSNFIGKADIKSHTNVIPFSAEETGLSMSVDIPHDKPHHVRVNDRMLEHDKKTIQYQSLRKKPDNMKNYTDDQKNPMMSRKTPIHDTGDRGSQDYKEQMAQTNGKGDNFAKYHKLTTRDDEIMKRLKINPQTGQIMSEKAVRTPANVAISVPMDPISLNERHGETKRANVGLANSRIANVNTKDIMLGSFAEYMSDAKKINPLLQATKTVTSRGIGTTAPQLDSDNKKLSDRFDQSQAFKQFWDELPRVAQENDVKKLEDLLIKYDAFVRVESAKTQADSKTAGNWSNEVDKSSERTMKALEQLEREQPQLWKTLEHSESPIVREKIQQMRLGKLDKSYESMQLNRSVELSMKRRDEQRNRAMGKTSEKNAKTQAGYMIEATDFESKLLEDRLVTDRFSAMANKQEWRTGETTMIGKQIDNKERNKFEEQMQSMPVKQVYETASVIDGTLLGAEEPTNKRIQPAVRTSKYFGKPQATGRITVNNNT